MLYVVTNVHSQINANLQRQNVHQSPSCRIRSNRQRPPASAPFALWEVWNPLRPKTGGDWRTSSNPRCRDKSPCRVLRQKSKNGWRKPATKRRAPSDPTETDRLAPSNPTRSRLNKGVKLVRYMSDTSSGASWK